MRSIGLLPPLAAWQTNGLFLRMEKYYHFGYYLNGNKSSKCEYTYAYQKAAR
jgi:hypothetical protein